MKPYGTPHNVAPENVSPNNQSSRARVSLPRHCPIETSETHPIDFDVLRTPRVSIGEFRCPVQHPRFRDSGSIQDFIVTFPRTAVWIQHEGSRPFLADPNLATIYNRKQRYVRTAASPAGDRCDWFGVSEAVAREIVATLEPVTAESERPFRFEWAPSPAPLYYRARRLLARARRHALCAMEAEEEVMALVATLLEGGYAALPTPKARRRLAVARHRDLADAARAELARHPERNASVHELAERLGTSPFHLCRVFRACTGRTMHRYRNELRVKLAMERLAADDDRETISGVAHDLGFASHAHFVLAMRRHVGETPSAVRGGLGERA
jgi:AraC family transcriptional regulator